MENSVAERQCSVSNQPGPSRQVDDVMANFNRNFRRHIEEQNMLKAQAARARELILNVKVKRNHLLKKKVKKDNFLRLEFCPRTRHFRYFQL